jgi:hypothetical protein
MTITEAYKHLQPISDRFGLELNRVVDFPNLVMFIMILL